MTELLTADNLISLLTLTLLEIVLGIDNIIFISIVAARVPGYMQKRARTIGLILALIVRVAMLLGISFIMGLTAPVFSLGSHDFSGRDLILLGGGIFLLLKTITEIRHKIKAVEEGKGDADKGTTANFAKVIFEIVLIDIVFSFDSILTAVGLSNQVPIMITAVVLSMIVMILASGKVADYVNKRPTVKMLALAFLVLIGGMLIIEGWHLHVEKGYIYFAMAFALGVEVLNRRMLRNAEKVHQRRLQNVLHGQHRPEGTNPIGD